MARDDLSVGEIGLVELLSFNVVLETYSRWPFTIKQRGRKEEKKLIELVEMVLADTFNRI